MKLLLSHRSDVLAGLLLASGLIASAAFGAGTTIPNASCDADTTPSNPCNSLSVACCKVATNPCSTYCSAYNSPADCNQAASKTTTCYQMTNVACGTSNNCSNMMPRQDGSGKDIQCTGAPDTCSNLAQP